VVLRISNWQIGALVAEQLQKKQGLSRVARIRPCLEVLVSNLPALHGNLRVGVRCPDSRAVPYFRGTAVIASRVKMILFLIATDKHA
jgi:hypothetical protein